MNIPDTPESSTPPRFWVAIDRAFTPEGEVRYANVSKECFAFLRKAIDADWIASCVHEVDGDYHLAPANFGPPQGRPQ